MKREKYLKLKYGNRNKERTEILMRADFNKTKCDDYNQYLCMYDIYE